MSTPGTSTLICCPVTVKNTITSGQTGTCIYTTAGPTILIYILPGIHRFCYSACGFFSSNGEGFSNHLNTCKTASKKVPSVSKKQGTKYIPVDVLCSAVTQTPSKAPKVLIHDNQTCIIHDDSYYYSCFYGDTFVGSSKFRSLHSHALKCIYLLNLAPNSCPKKIDITPVETELVVCPCTKWERF